MIATPALGQPVQVWYRAGVRDIMPLHGKTGVVVIRSHGRPRNHAVRIGGRVYVVPCGNLRQPLDTAVKRGKLDMGTAGNGPAVELATGYSSASASEWDQTTECFHYQLVRQSLTGSENS